MRKRDYTYQLTVDPDRIHFKKDMRSMILQILVDNGGSMNREDLLTQFEARLKKERPDLKTKASSCLSLHQRTLRDEKIIRITDSGGNVISTKQRRSILY